MLEAWSWELEAGRKLLLAYWDGKWNCVSAHMVQVVMGHKSVDILTILFSHMVIRSVDSKGPSRAMA